MGLHKELEGICNEFAKRQYGIDRIGKRVIKTAVYRFIAADKDVRDYENNHPELNKDPFPFDQFLYELKIVRDVEKEILRSLGFWEWYEFMKYPRIHTYYIEEQ
jgi:hypothetical protein